jgi:hypothetical protein
MNKWTLALAGSIALSMGCNKGPSDEPPPGKSVATPAVTDFSGTYSSTWGPSTFAQTGSKVTCHYPNGSMTCDVVGELLKCTWRESSTFGLATLKKLTDGKISGTWGNNGSDRDGGVWTFIPKH